MDSLPDAYPDLKKFLDHLHALPTDLLQRSQTIYISRTPGRLDLMGKAARAGRSDHNGDDSSDTGGARDYPHDRPLLFCGVRSRFSDRGSALEIRKAKSDPSLTGAARPGSDTAPTRHPAPRTPD